jgi:cysteine desulfurase
VRIEELDRLLTEDTALVSIMAANNETGVLQPIQDIARLVKARNGSTLFHTDATQAVGKIPVDLCGSWQDVDILSFSAHKFHGPKGVGGLYARPEIELPPMILGGGQENGRRSGTVNTPALAGLAVAADLADLRAFSAVAELRDRLEETLLEKFPSVTVHSAAVSRLPNTSCFSIPSLSGDGVAETLAAKGVVVGTGAACSSGTLHPPKTLLAMGVQYSLARSAIRVSLSRDSTQQDVCRCLTEMTLLTK